jgi:hypothetical protein
MKLQNEIKSLTLPNSGGTIVLIPEGIDNAILKSVLYDQKNKIILLGNSVGKAIFKDYKMKAKKLQKLMELSETQTEVYS